MTQRVSIGRIVHYVLGTKPGEDGAVVPVVRPAIVVQVWSDTCVNLSVFTDGTNDDEHLEAFERSASASVPGDPRVPAARVVGRMSRNLDLEANKVGTWFWPPYVPPAVRLSPTNMPEGAT